MEEALQQQLGPDAPLSPCSIHWQAGSGGACSAVCGSTISQLRSEAGAMYLLGAQVAGDEAEVCGAPLVRPADAPAGVIEAVCRFDVSSIFTQHIANRSVMIGGRCGSPLCEGRRHGASDRCRGACGWSGIADGSSIVMFHRRVSHLGALRPVAPHGGSHAALVLPAAAEASTEVQRARSTGTDLLRLFWLSDCASAGSRCGGICPECAFLSPPRPDLARDEPARLLGCCFGGVEELDGLPARGELWKGRL